MTRLEQRALELAQSITGEYFDGPPPNDIADAMVRLAREFAADALRECFSEIAGDGIRVNVPGLCLESGPTRLYFDPPTSVEVIVAAAIAAAEGE
jgi:hypothetical protein